MQHQTELITDILVSLAVFIALTPTIILFAIKYVTRWKHSPAALLERRVIYEYLVRANQQDLAVDVLLGRHHRHVKEDGEEEDGALLEPRTHRLESEETL